MIIGGFCHDNYVKMLCTNSTIIVCMRLLAMIKNSTTCALLAGLFFLLLNPFSATAQIDQDNNNLGILECNNLDPSVFDTDLDNFLSTQSVSYTHLTLPTKA